jgi:hypothetical protein
MLEIFRLPHTLAAYNQEPLGRELANGPGSSNRSAEDERPRPAPGSPGWYRCGGPFPNMWEAVMWKSANEPQYGADLCWKGARYINNWSRIRNSSRLRKPAIGPTEEWSFLMRTADRRMFRAYFQRKAAHPDISGALPNTAYKAQWFDPRTGAWSNAGSGSVKSDSQGLIGVPARPAPDEDWALSLSSQ